jgi:hypothetical protein
MSAALSGGLQEIVDALPLDGPHPEEAGKRAKARLTSVLRASAPLFIDGGKPLRRIPVDD